MEENETLTARQLCKRLGVSSHSVRRLCNLGLVPHVRRNRAGQRIFNTQQCEWVKTLLRLRTCGFSDADLKKYAKLSRDGDATIGERRAIIATKKRQAWQMLEDLQQNIDFLERRDELLESINERKIDQESYWL